MKKDYSIWEMRDGTKISLKDMTNSHLQNTMNMLKNKTLPNLKEEKEAVSSFMCAYDNCGIGVSNGYLGLLIAIDDATQYLKAMELELSKITYQ